MPTRTHTNLNDLFQDIANAIHDKGGYDPILDSEGKYLADNFPDSIATIDTDPSGDATATADDILSPKTAYAQGNKITGTIQTKNDSGNTTLNTTTTSKSYAAGYYPNAHGAEITLEAKTGADSIAPTETSQTITPTSGKVLSAVEVDAIPSDYVGSAIDRRDQSDLVIDGPMITAPAGYYSSSASESVRVTTHSAPEMSRTYDSTTNTLNITATHTQSTSG